MQQTLVEYLINAAWQIPLVAAGAVIVTRIAGLSPRGRNLAWLGFLAVAVISPGLSTRLAPSAGVAPSLTAPTGEALVEPSPLAANLDQASPSHLLRIDLDRRSAALIKLAFVTAAAMAFARLAIAGLSAHRLVRDSHVLDLPAHLQGALDRFARTHACRIPPVRISSRIASPVVVGALRPVVLVPERFASLSRDDQQAALLHEFAHVRRCDYAINLLCEAAALPVSWHPALYAIKAGVRRTRELACDAMASAAMTSEETYARCLLSLAKTLGTTADEPSLAMVGLFGKTDLEDRLMHLLKPKATQSGGVRAARLGGGALIAAMALTPAILFRVTPALAAAQAAPTVALAEAAASAPPATPAVAVVPASPAPVHRHRHVTNRHAPVPLTAPVSDQDRVAEQAREDAGGDDVFLARAKDHRNAVRDKDDRVAMVNSGRIADEVHRAMERAAAAERLTASPTFKQKLAELTAHQAALADIDRDRIQNQMEAMTEANQAHIQEALARTQARIASETARRGKVEAERIRCQLDQAMRQAERALREQDHAPTAL